MAQPQRQFRLAKMTDKMQAYTNCLYMNPQDMVNLGLERDTLICVDEILVHKVRGDAKLEQGTIGTSSLHWNALHLDKNKALGKTVKVERWTEARHNSGNVCHMMTVVVDTYAKAETEIDVEELEAFIHEMFGGEVFCKDQRWVTCWRKHGREYWLSLRVANVYVRKEGGAEGIEEKSSETDKGGNKNKMRGLREARFANMGPDTIVTLMAATNPYLKLKQPQGGIRAFGPDWDAEGLGIGGLDAQFSTIFRRAFASRLYPPDLVKQLGVKHVKGMLLHGPPGTGKTLIARNIGYMLTEREPKVVNGPEILNKFVGQSEENIRELFREAREDQEKNADKAGLHIIIFDEIDAICKQRGSTNTGTGVHDTVVNQLLSMVDGVNSLNNILVIGMTNRKDLIDEALLRSGRLEVHIEIGLPDEQGREQIFRIHTKALRENGFLSDEISLAEYAARTKNYSGAEIEAVVRSAVSYAMQQHIDVDNLQALDVKRLRTIKVSKEYFELALQEVRPEFGVNDDDLQLHFGQGIYEFNQQVSDIIALSRQIVQRLKASPTMNRQALMLRGGMGSGKSALATYLAVQAEFHFVRVLSANDFVGASDLHISARIAKVFNDAYKSKLSVIVIDDFERLIGYTIGPRFSNLTLQALLTSIRRQPDDLERKIFIIVTCTSDVVRTLEVDRFCDYVLDMPLVGSREELANVFKSAHQSEMCRPDLQSVVAVFPEKNASIGIADLLGVIELAVTDENVITPQSFRLALSNKLRGGRNASALYDLDG